MIVGGEFAGDVKQAIKPGMIVPPSWWAQAHHPRLAVPTSGTDPKRITP
jgi:hypothetical protein